MNITKIIKGLSAIMVSATLTASFSMSAMALKNISLTDNADGTVTVTAEDTEKLAVTQYDKLGFIKTMGISTAIEGAESVTVEYDSSLPVKVIGFNDWDNLQADTKAYQIGNRTLAYVDFERVMDSNYVVNEQGYQINRDFKTTDKYGNETTAMYITGASGDPALNFNVQASGCYTNKSDVVVFEYDVMLPSNEGIFVGFIKHVKEDGSAGGWQLLWKIQPNDTEETATDGEPASKIVFGDTAIAERVMQTDKWYRVSAVRDSNRSVIRFYFENEYVGETATIANTYPADIFYLQPSGGQFTDIIVDNVRVYEGTQPREVIDPYKVEIDLEMPSIVDKNETAQREILDGKYVIHTRSGVATDAYGKKTLLSVMSHKNDGEVYVPANEICSAWGISIPQGVTPDENGYVALTALASAMGVNIYTVDADINDGMIVLGSSFEAPASADDLQKLNDYGFYYRASDDEVLAAYRKSSVNGVHPRLFATQDDFDRIRADYEAGTDEVFMKWANGLIAYADSRLDTDVPVYSEVYKNDRVIQRKLKSDIYSWAMAFHLTGDRKYVDEVFEELNYFCEFPDWYPNDHLDLVETIDAFAIGYDWLYNEFTPEQRKIIEENMYSKGYIPTYIGFRAANSAMTTAFYASNNHGTVCNGSVTMTALAFMDVYPEESAWIVSNAMMGMEINLYRWYHGAWWEGPHYWDYAVAYTVKFIESMQSVLGTDYGFKSMEGLDRAATSEIGMHSGIGSFNYSDGIQGNYYTPEMLWIANQYGQRGVATKVAQESKSEFQGGNRRTGEPLALALIWYDPDMVDDEVNLPMENLYDTLHILTARSGWDSKDTFFAVKGGVLNEAHSQLDSGSFIFESDGIRWFQDLGMGPYVDGYFDSASGGLRWKHIAARAEGHSTVSVNPGDVEDMKASDTSAVARLTLIDKDDSGVIASMDMSEVLFDVNSAKRGFFFTDNRQSLVVRDEINLRNTHVFEDFDGKTQTDVMGTHSVSYEIVSGESLGLQKGDDVAKLTAQNDYFNSNPWNAKAEQPHVTYDFDVYLDDVRNVFQFYPIGSNRYGVQLGGSEDGKVYCMMPSPTWSTVATDTTIEAGKWYNVAVEYNMPEGEMYIYLEDELIYTQTGLSTTSLPPADQCFKGVTNVKNTYVYVNNIRSYTGEYRPENKDYQENTVYWRLITDQLAEVEVDEETNTITLTRGESGVKVEYKVEGAKSVQVTFEKPIVPIISDAYSVTVKQGRATLKILADEPTVNITAKITPNSVENPTPLSDYTKAISSWTLN